MIMAKANANEIALKIKATATELGWTHEVRNLVLTISKKITPGSKDSFREADMEYYSILDLLPQTSPGSIWGTDGGGIGAVSAMRSGTFTMHKSGGSKRVLNALKKLQETKHDHYAASIVAGD
jgi:hypothetical protein